MVLVENLEGLNVLRQKRVQIQRQMDDLKEKLEILDDAIDIVSNNGQTTIPLENQIVELPIPSTVVINVLTHADRKLRFPQIVKAVEKIGTSSTAKSLSGTVYSILMRLAKTDKITITGIKRNRLYQWNRNIMKEGKLVRYEIQH